MLQEQRDGRAMNFGPKCVNEERHVLEARCNLIELPILFVLANGWQVVLRS